MFSPYRGSDALVVDGRTKKLYWVESLPPDRASEMARLWVKVDAFGMWTSQDIAYKFLAQLRRDIRAVGELDTAAELNLLRIEGHWFRIASKSTADESIDDVAVRAIRVSRHSLYGDICVLVG
jgi:hypothetical protein